MSRTRLWVAVGIATALSLACFAGCRTPFSSALDPRPLDPVERGEYGGPR